MIKIISAKRIAVSGLLVVAICFTLGGQSTGSRTYQNRIEWGPQYLPGSITLLTAASDIRVTEITLAILSTCSDTTVTVEDNQATPMPLVSLLNMSNTAANGPKVFAFESPGRLFPAGVKWVASQANCIVGWLSGY